ncbi:phage tail protein [Xenorhabdus innexi]|uniref:phage tail protein n=1 Tax=Xenorhabdus innexi TaxID=290109 RepID=UPI001FD5B521|nr:hypothetical protein [Xenorhabdus innexi]
MGIFGQIGVRIFASLGMSLNILSSIGTRVFGSLSTAFNALFSKSGKNNTFIQSRKDIGALGNIGQKVFGFLGNSINTLANIGSKGLGLLGNAFSAIGRVIMVVGRVMMANPILAIIGVIAMAAIYIWQNWESLGPKFMALWDSVKNIFSGAWEGIKNLVSNAWEGIKSFFMNGGLIGIIYQNWDSIKQSASEAWEFVKSIISGAWESVKQNTSEIWEGVKKTISDKWNEIVSDVQAIPEKLKVAGSEMIDAILGGIQEKWKVLKDKFKSFGDAVKSFFGGSDKKDVELNTSEEITRTEATKDLMPAKKLDKGGYIANGEIAIVGERGPELVAGSASVTSRLDTAKYAAFGVAMSSMTLPVAAQNAPLHPQSLPAHAYEEVQAKRAQSQPQQFSGAAPQYNIYVYGSQGQSAQDIARMVRQELEQRERMQQARMRSSLSDRGGDFS